MVEFKKTKMGSMYQISVSGRRENRKAVITKFARQKDWSVAYFYTADSLKANEVVDGFKTLKDAKYSAECHVDV